MRYKYLIYIVAVFLIFTSCKDQEPNVTDDGYEASEAPETINQSNIITVEFFSKLNDETLFSSSDYQAIISHITSDKASLAFLFDRSDIYLGQKSPIVDIALESKLKSFFIQNDVDDSVIHGTGMIVRPLVPVYDGIGIPDTLFLAGCTVTAALVQPTVVTLMTCKLSDSFQFPVLVRSLGDGLQTNKIVVGTIKTDVADGFKDYLKYHLKNFRLSFYSSSETNATYEIFYLTPVEFVKRETTEMTVSGLPLYQSKIEYLDN
ncbi:MAG: hypothetical protein PHH37_02990 [Paludibacter sp.]|nr:hypothetical protein [Paludibacter sp.]